MPRICTYLVLTVWGLEPIRRHVLEKPKSPPLRNHYLSLALHLGVGPGASTLASQLVLHCEGLGWAAILLRFHGYTFIVIYRQCYLITKSLFLWLLTTMHASACVCVEMLRLVLMHAVVRRSCRISCSRSYKGDKSPDMKDTN